MGKTLLIWGAQAVVAVALAGGLAWTALTAPSHSKLPPLLERPREIGPRYDVPVVATDEQLSSVLLRVRPRLYGAETVIGHVDHNLRCWGDEAEFDDPQFVSGSEMRALLTRHSQYVALYGVEAQPLLLDRPGGGIKFRTLEGSRSSSHVDHTTASLGEIGTPLDFPIETPTRTGTFRDVVEQAIRDFSLEQAEYEWSAMTFALFIDADRFTSNEGRTVTFDMITRRIMRQRLPQGVCLGNHRLHGLTILLRVDEQRQAEGKPFLTPAVRDEIVAFLDEQTKLLVAHQHQDGFWSSNWPTAKPSQREPGGEGDEMSDRLIATGHALEWWACAPESVHPPRAVLAAAGQWLVTTIEGLTEDELRRYQSFLSHAVRALCLWRNRLPQQVELTGGPA